MSCSPPRRAGASSEAIAFLEALDAARRARAAGDGRAPRGVRHAPRYPPLLRRPGRPARGAVRRRGARRCSPLVRRGAGGDASWAPAARARTAPRSPTRSAAASARGRARGQRPRTRHRRHARTGAASTEAACRSRWWRPGRTSSIRGATGALHERVAASRARALGAPARHRAVPLELPGAEPDHGRAGADDARGGGRGSERQPDHRGVREGPRPLRRRRARAGHIEPRARHRTTC